MSRKHEAERFWRRVDKSGDCWIYTGSRSSGGYGTVRFDGGYGLAHRIAYTLLRGPIPDGLDLDHLCRIRACVRPDHLEPVTRKVNAMRGAMTFAFSGRCISGRHEIKAESDTKMTNHGRTCRACYGETQSRHYADIKAAAVKLGIPITRFISTYGKSAKKAREVLRD